MANTDNERILRLRNESSLYLDDMVALVVNSSLAGDLRQFSAEVMQLTPGFTFTLKKARDLRELTFKTLRQYEAHSIGDIDLMRYRSEAQSVLRGDDIENGGRKMAIMNFFRGRERKAQESLEKLKDELDDVCKRIAASEDIMERSVKAASGQRPDSIIYRSSERDYNNAERDLKMLRREEEQLRVSIDNAEQQMRAKAHADRVAQTAGLVQSALATKEDQDKTLATLQRANDLINAANGTAQQYAAEIDETLDEPAVSSRTSSAFGARVAESERLSARMEAAGVTAVPEEEPKQEQSAFARAVGKNSADQ